MARLTTGSNEPVLARVQRTPWVRALPLVLILSAAAALRLYGLNWDAGQWLQPDERQIYFVANSLGWPQSLSQALSPTSPLNPHFFAYGSFPIYLLRLVALLVAPLAPAVRDPGNLHLVGRPLAALLDVATVYLAYRLTRVLEQSEDAASGRVRALLAAALLALAVLPVQAAHFYTADTVLTFLVMASLNLAAGVARGAGWRWQAALGATVGLAMATKLTAVPLGIAAIVACGIGSTRSRSTGAGRAAGATSRALVTAGVAVSVFLLVQPYALIDARSFVADTVKEAQIAWGKVDVPFTRQYAGTWPYLYSMWQTGLWGLGLVPGLVAWAAFFAAALRWLRTGVMADGLLLAWAMPYLALVGALHTRYLRYMLPLVPVLCILTARFVLSPDRQAPRAGGWLDRWRRQPATRRKGAGLPGASRWRAGIGAFVLLAWSLAYVISFASIYSEAHPWVRASEWIYRSVPVGAALAIEDWDTPIPLPVEVDGQARRIAEYDVRTLRVYDEPDDELKWTALAAEVAASDYLIIASRRAYGSISRLPDRYPLAGRYYALLFSRQLGFVIAGEFTRGADWLNPRVEPVPAAAPALLWPDESFVVYDHPRVFVLRNAERLSANQIVHRLASP